MLLENRSGFQAEIINNGFSTFMNIWWDTGKLSGCGQILLEGIVPHVLAFPRPSHYDE